LGGTKGVMRGVFEKLEGRRKHKNLRKNLTGVSGPVAAIHSGRKDCHRKTDLRNKPSSGHQLQSPKEFKKRSQSGEFKGATVGMRADVRGLGEKGLGHEIKGEHASTTLEEVYDVFWMNI